jgi:hypothetical protein
MRLLRALCLPALLLASAAAPARSAPLRTEGLLAGTYYLLVVEGETPLPDGTLWVIRIERRVGSGRTAGNRHTLYAETKNGRFEARWRCARAMFRPGRYVLEASPQADQPERVKPPLTEAQRAIRLRGTFETGRETSPAVLAADVCLPVVTSLQTIVAAGEGWAEQRAAAEAGTLTAAAWSQWKTGSGVGAAAARIGRALEGREIPFYFPSSAAILPLLARVRAALAAGDAAARGRSKDNDGKEADWPEWPIGPEIDAPLKAVQLDAADLFTATIEDVLAYYALRPGPDGRLAVQPPSRAEQAQLTRNVDHFERSWTRFKALPWRTDLPGALEPLERLGPDAKALLKAKFGGGKGATADAIVARLKDRCLALRSAVAAARMKARRGK